MISPGVCTADFRTTPPPSSYTPNSAPATLAFLPFLEHNELVFASGEVGSIFVVPSVSDTPTHSVHLVGSSLSLLVSVEEISPP